VHSAIVQGDGQGSLRHSEISKHRLALAPAEFAPGAAERFLDGLLALFEHAPAAFEAFPSLGPGGAGKGGERKEQ
jgi:hypothetical protein